MVSEALEIVAKRLKEKSREVSFLTTFGSFPAILMKGNSYLYI